VGSHPPGELRSLVHSGVDQEAPAHERRHRRVQAAAGGGLRPGDGGGGREEVEQRLGLRVEDEAGAEQGVEERGVTVLARDADEKARPHRRARGLHDGGGATSWSWWFPKSRR